MHPTPETIEPFDRENEQWRVMIETPKGSRNKYKYDPELAVSNWPRCCRRG